ncbi:MAG: biotin synthase BioB [Candidatus Sabulitectum sp.]|nr:biotin synthase BioB [Candidatus Sabulitectum sp.]
MNRQNVLEILTTTPLDQVEIMCNDLRSARFGNRVDLCAIVNAKNGACSEDCAFCAQSGSRGEPMMELDELINTHHSNSDAGVHRFSMVTSGRGLWGKEFQRICDAASAGSGYCQLCASLGILGFRELKLLHAAGVSRYHHNLETSSAFFPSVCTTHNWDERAMTVRRAKLAGMSVCSGGIIGMGESDEDRIDLAFSLLELEVDSIALNFFVPVEGVSVEGENLSTEKLLRIIGMFRMVNPSAELRICAGRNKLDEMSEKMFSFGVTGIMTGTLLTTEGSQFEDDLDLLRRAGYKT